MYVLFQGRDCVSFISVFLYLAQSCHVVGFILSEWRTLGLSPVRIKGLKPQRPGLQGLRNQTRPTCWVLGVWEVHLEACWASGEESSPVLREPRQRAKNSNNSAPQFCSVGRFTEGPHIPYRGHLSAQQPPADVRARRRRLPGLECQSDRVEASGLFTCNTCGVGSQRPIEENLAPFESQLCKEPWRMMGQEARINIELSF